MGEESLQANFVHNISNYSGDVLCCAFSGRLLAISSADKLVRLFVVDESFTELPQSPLCGHSYAVNYLCFSPLGTTLSSCSQDGYLISWDVRTGGAVSKVHHESGQSLRVVAHSTDGRLLATGSDDETVCLWDARTSQLVRSLEGHESSVVAVAFSPDTNYIVSGTNLGDLRVCDARFGLGRHLAMVKQAHDLGVTCAAFSPTHGLSATCFHVGDLMTSSANNHYLLATGGADNAVRLWKLETSNKQVEPVISAYTVLEGHTQDVMCIAFSPNSSRLASGSGDKTVIVWDPLKGTNLIQLSYHQRYVTCVAFSSDANLLASGSNDKQVAIWKFGGSLVELEKPGGKGKVVSTGGRPNPHRTLTDWSMNDVLSWLTSIRMQEYCAAFARNLIDGQELSHLNDSMLKNSLHIEALGHRNRILRAIKQLKEGHATLSGPALSHVALGVCQSVPVSNGQPHEFLCPITHEVMVDPVIAADGYTYERSAMSAWTESGRRTSPMTNAPLATAALTPNRMLKMLINKTNKINK